MLTQDVRCGHKKKCKTQDTDMDTRRKRWTQEKMRDARHKTQDTDARHRLELLEIFDSLCKSLRILGWLILVAGIWLWMILSIDLLIVVFQ